MIKILDIKLLPLKSLKIVKIIETPPQLLDDEFRFPKPPKKVVDELVKIPKLSIQFSVDFGKITTSSEEEFTAILRSCHL